MARNKGIQQDIDGSDLSNYPDKRIRDDDGSGNGTPVTESVYGDIHEFFAKMMREAGISYNNVPDNVSNGYQLYDAMLLLANKNDYVKNLVEASADTLQVPFPLGSFKVDESLFVRAQIDSVPEYIKIKGSDGTVKNCVIGGSGFKTASLVRLINLGTHIEAIGLYDSVNVPNLEQRLLDLENSYAPVAQVLSVFIEGGGMIFWNKIASEIPDGWQEVVDWRGRIPAGFLAGDAVFGVTGVPGGEGGSPSKTLSIAEMPDHDHDTTVTIDGGGSADLQSMVISSNADERNVVGPKTGKTGGGQPFSIMNPYRTVLFIEYVGV